MTPSTVSQWRASIPPCSFCWKVSLTGFLVLEMVLGLSSNLTVLVLYCMKQNLISSVSNIITMNLHVVDVLVSLFSFTKYWLLLLNKWPLRTITSYWRQIIKPVQTGSSTLWTTLHSTTSGGEALTSLTGDYKVYQNLQWWETMCIKSH